MRLQRQQWRQTKRQLLQTGMLGLPASAKAAGRRTRSGAAAADLTDTDSEAEDELDRDPPEGEDSSALTETFRDAAPKGALLGVVLTKAPDLHSQHEAVEGGSCPHQDLQHCGAYMCTAGLVNCRALRARLREPALHLGCCAHRWLTSIVWGACCNHANSVACAQRRLSGMHRLQ